jgi:hypothetical protein
VLLSIALEKVGLAFVGGASFLFVATTPAPQLQTLVAPVACGGATASAVVRYPHVVEPVDMVRNTPLVCVAEGSATLASTWRVLPALFAIGFAATLVALVVGGIVVRATRRDEGPRPPRALGDSLRWLPLLIAAPQVVLTSVVAYWWLAVDTPHRVTACRSSSGGRATCYDGEPTYRMLTFVFGALALACLVAWAVIAVRSRSRRARFARAWADPVRAEGTLVDVDATSTKVNGGRVYRYTYEVAPDDGTPPFRFTERGRSSPAGSVGGTVHVLYERNDRTNAFTVPALPPPPPDGRPGSDPSPLVSAG